MYVQELAKQIDDYTATYGPDDQLEWSLVLGEIRAFIEVFCRSFVCSFIHSFCHALILQA